MMHLLPPQLSFAPSRQPRTTSSPIQNAFWGAYIAILMVLLSNSIAQTQTCTVSPRSNPVSDRQIQLDINCPAPLFKLSESPDFEESVDTGVVVNLEAVDPLGSYADLTIQYPNGVNTDIPTPFSVSASVRPLRILAVLFNFSNGALALPGYATREWIDKLVFGNNHDGLGLANSIKAHIEQNTYGTVSVSGEVYPDQVVVGPIDDFRNLNLTPAPERQFAQKIVQQLVDTDPDFFVGKDFDFLIALTPGGLQATTLQPYALYPQWSDPNGVFEGWALYDLPIESNSQLFDIITDEQRLSVSTTIVVPQYNPHSVFGVWLATDNDHSGVNYYTGGSVRYDVSNPNHFAYFIELGTPLPDENTEVIVTYKPRAYRRLTDAQMLIAPPDTMPDTFWYGLIIHELYHAAGWLLNPAEKGISDLYQSPVELISNYGLMSEGSFNQLTIDGVKHYFPSQLSAYSKVNLGILQPFEVPYGNPITNIRLYRTEERDFHDTNERIKVIKVPLHEQGDIGFRHLVKYPNTEVTFSGEEYLLLEWRDKDDVNNGAFNFDIALPHSGLLVYRVIEGNPASHGNNNLNLVRIADATPPVFSGGSLSDLRSEEVFSLETSPAPYGAASGVFTYVASAAWNWKAADTTTAQMLLSPGNGDKTIYAKFMDLNGDIIHQSSISVTLLESQNAPPVADPGPSQTLADDGDGAEWVTLDGSQSYDPDGTLSRYEWHEAGIEIANGITPTVRLAVGEHTITLVVFDSQNASDSKNVQITVTPLPPNVAPVANAGADQTVSDGNNDGIETVTLDGSMSSDADGAIQTYEWYENNTLLANGINPTVSLPVGEHRITLSVTDDRGATSSDYLTVCLSGAPGQLAGEASEQLVTLIWVDNSCNETGFRIELGQKVKGQLQFDLYANTEPNVTVYSAPFADGSHKFRVQAEESGQTGYSNTVSVTVGSSTKGGNGGKKR